MKSKELNNKEARIKIETLKLIKVDSVNWFSYYLDENLGQKWKEDRPDSGYHGGGHPRLRLIDKFPWEEDKKII